MATKLPVSYTKASWRCTIPYHEETDQMGIGFDLEDGAVLRLAIDRASAVDLAETIMGYLAASDSQSPMSLDIPSVEGSIPIGHGV